MPVSVSDAAELQRLLAEGTRRSHASAPVAFAKHLGISPDEWQARVLSHTGKRLLLNCCRQSGKSTTTAILALHRALYTPNALVLIVSPSQRQSRELLRKIVQLVPRLPVAPTVDAENTQTVEFSNGSRIVSLPSSEDTIRGFSAVSLLIIDEAGDVDDKLYKAVRPMLAVSNGQLVVLGTPKGRRGFYFDAWERGGPVWDRIEIRASDCPRISKEFLEEERRALGDAFDQEYGARFVNLASGRVYAGFDELRNVLPALPHNDTRTPWTFLLGMDFGVRDDTAFTVVAYRDHDPVVYIPESYKRPGLSPSDAALEVRALEKRYSFSRIIGDVGGLGKAFQIEAAQRFYLAIEAAEKSNKLGFIRLLNGDLSAGKIQIVGPACVPLVDEWTSLSWVETPEGNRKENPSQANHCADSALYVWRAAVAWGNRPNDAKPPTREDAIRMESSSYWARVEREIEDEREFDLWAAE